ncbi:hypothetical protein PG984_000073 [Apiospora sp. TS-2023a]
MAGSISAAASDFAGQWASWSSTQEPANRHLEKETESLPYNGEFRYIVGLNVFHDLYCVWNVEWQFYQPQAVGDHMCRNFGAVQDWAREHAVGDDWDHEFPPMNDPLDPDTWIPGWYPQVKRPSRSP